MNKASSLLFQGNSLILIVVSMPKVWFPLILTLGEERKLATSRHQSCPCLSVHIYPYTPLPPSPLSIIMPDVTDTLADNSGSNNKMNQDKPTESTNTNPSTNAIPQKEDEKDPVSKLKEFGFPEDRIFYALQVTSGGFQPALEW